MTSEKEKGPPVPPACASCLCLTHLVDQIIKGAIDFLVTIKFGHKKISREEYAREFEKASFVFIQHLRERGFLPAKTNAPDDHDLPN